MGPLVKKGTVMKKQDRAEFDIALAREMSRFTEEYREFVTSMLNNRLIFDNHHEFIAFCDRAFNEMKHGEYPDPSEGPETGF